MLSNRYFQAGTFQLHSGYTLFQIYLHWVFVSQRAMKKSLEQYSGLPTLSEQKSGDFRMK